ncbi:MAG TPA: class F sortase [Jiangellales bacterium]|nr:class F sortase [Jiangellales bacterium]
MTRSPARRLLVPAVVAAVALAAVAAPVAWAFSQRGDEVDGTLGSAAASAPRVDETPPAPTVPVPAAPPVPDIPVRDASLQALAARAVVPPVRVEVPAVGITAEVDQVGVAEDGQMDLPPDPDRVGWYRFGAAPGEDQGSAVLAAHVDSRRYGLGQFSRLPESSPGDRVVVVLADGRSVEHEVVDVRSESKAAVQLDSLFRREGEPALVLVTCGGVYDASARSYEDNVVVTAVPVGGSP